VIALSRSLFVYVCIDAAVPSSSSSTGGMGERGDSGDEVGGDLSQNREVTEVAKSLAH
jgi:hypothetical protein